MTTTADDVWRLLAELVEAQKETERILKEQSLETERMLKEQSLESDRRFQKTDRQITRLSKEIGNLGGKWGHFVENMIAPAIEEGADKYAYRQGLFVLAQSGESVAILNGTEFEAKTW